MMIEFLFLLLRPNPKCNIFSGKINKSFSSYVLLSNSDIHTEADNIYPIRYSGHIGVGEASLRPYLYACLCVSFSFRALVSSFKDSRRQLLSHLAFFFMLRAVFAKWWWRCCCMSDECSTLRSFFLSFLLSRRQWSGDRRRGLKMQSWECFSGFCGQHFFYHLSRHCRPSSNRCNYAENVSFVSSYCVMLGGLKVY